MQVEINEESANARLRRIVNALIVVKQKYPDDEGVHELYLAMKDARDALWSKTEGDDGEQPLSGGECPPGSCG